MEIHDSPGIYDKLLLKVDQWNTLKLSARLPKLQQLPQAARFVSAQDYANSTAMADGESSGELRLSDCRTAGFEKRNCIGLKRMASAARK